MLSLKIVTAFALLAVVIALPASQSPTFPNPITTISNEDIEDGPFPWFKFPLFGNLFAPLWNLFPNFAEIGPKIVSDEKTFKVIVPVKSYEQSDLKVKVKGDILIVEGSHEGGKDSHDSFTSQFLHSYSLPENSTSADVTAELSSDGFLIVTVPLNGPSKGTEEKREVPIVESKKPFEEEKTTITPLEIEEDKKEPTTPIVDRQEITEKDNVIPHGTEAL